MFYLVFAPSCKNYFHVQTFLEFIVGWKGGTTVSKSFLIQKVKIRKKVFLILYGINFFMSPCSVFNMIYPL